jgi:hypothetical protein
VTKNAGEIENALAAAAPILSGAEIPALRAAGQAQAGLATSIREAIGVSRRLSPNQLNIPLNPQAGGKLMMPRDGQKPITIGGMKITILGPTASHLKKLRNDWNTWLRENKEALAKVRTAAKRDEERLGASDLTGLLLMLRLQAESFGNPLSVTPPNLASLTLLVEEGSESVLLTGDARGDQIVDGLKETGHLTDGTFAIDVLKVPHHGSENNIDSDFCDTVIARDYVFCGNGEHENPDLRVVEMMARRRLAAKGAGKFRFWFNSKAGMSEKAAAIDHMTELEVLAKKLVKNSKGQMTVGFLSTSSVRVL